MRICYVGNIDSVHTQRWAVHFSRAGHEVHLVYAGGRERNIRLLEDASVRVHLLSRPPRDRGLATSTDRQRTHVFRVSVRRSWRAAYARLPSPVKRIIFYYGLQSLRLRRVLDEIRPDLVHAWFLPDSGCVAGLTGFHPLVVSSWGSDVTLETWPGSSRLAAWANRFALRQADRVTATSEWLAKETQKFAAPETVVHIIPFGIDCQVFTPRPRGRHEGIRIGFAKHLKTKYGPDTLLEAVARLAPRHPDLRLDMVGEGEMRDELEVLTDRMGLNNRVRSLGGIPHSEMPSFLATLDIAVQPSRHRSESFGVAGLEASAMGLPVVATRMGGVPETVLDGKTGILVPPDDPGALAEALGTLIVDADLRRRMGGEGRRWVLRRYQWGACTRAMERVYEGIQMDSANP